MHSLSRLSLPSSSKTLLLSLVVLDFNIVLASFFVKICSEFVKFVRSVKNIEIWCFEFIFECFSLFLSLLRVFCVF